jgi:hypothetical protein
VSIRNDLLEQILTAIQTAGQSGKAFIALQSDTVQAISTDAANPTILDNWVVLASNDISLQGDSIRNDSGRTIAFMSGTIGIHPQVDGGGGGGSREMNLTSEISTNGTDYVIANRNRPIFTQNNVETFNTKESYLTGFAPNSLVRFIMHTDLPLSLAPSTSSYRGVGVTGPAALWILTEA